MFTFYKKIPIFAIFIIFFIGCSDRDLVKEYDKPAIYWYKKIIESLSESNFDKADNYYISLRSEHSRSPLLPTATMILAQAHMEDKSYLMADYYLDEYIKKYASGKSVELAKFLKIKASFLGVKDINKEQKLMLDTLNSVERFLKNYPNSIYRPMVDTIKVRLHMTQYLLNENIARLYDRIGKAKASKIYREKNEKSVLKSADIKPPEESLLDKIFN
jgi:outer membrane protein assembly factor BamD